MERLQFIATLVWMVAMLVMVVIAMRDLIKSENEEHRQRPAQEDQPRPPGEENKPAP